MLVVDDEMDIANMLAQFFRMEGYDVSCANSGREALAAVSSGVAPDIMLLDVNMPGMDGFEVCRRVREHLSCPIIFLTARIEDVDQLDGFSAGADDYVMKPFSLEVLGRRVAAHMAREGRMRSHENAVRFFRELTIDYGQRTVEVRPASGGRASGGRAESGVRGASGDSVDCAGDKAALVAAPGADVGEGAARAGVGIVGVDARMTRGGTGTAGVGAGGPFTGAETPRRMFVDLTKLEFDIVALLSKRPGQVFDRDAIYERVWGWDAAGDPSQVREHVRRIRNKLTAAGVADDPIETVWGVGYKWVAK